MYVRVAGIRVYISSLLLRNGIPSPPAAHVVLTCIRVKDKGARWRIYTRRGGKVTTRLLDVYSGKGKNRSISFPISTATSIRKFFFFLLSNSLRKVSVSIRVPFETFSLEKGSELLYRINRFRKYFYGWIKNGWNLALMLEKDVWGRRESKIGRGKETLTLRFVSIARSVNRSSVYSRFLQVPLESCGFSWRKG